MYSVEFKNNNTYITLEDEFDLAQTLDCGQAFRWEIITDNKWHGIAFNKYLCLEKLENGCIVLYDTTKEDFEKIWKNFLTKTFRYAIIYG